MTLRYLADVVLCTVAFALDPSSIDRAEQRRVDRQFNSNRTPYKQLRGKDAKIARERADDRAYHRDLFRR